MICTVLWYCFPYYAAAMLLRLLILLLALLALLNNYDCETTLVEYSSRL